MKIVATMLARNEAWCLPATARSALRWCDQLVMLDHASTDATPAVIDQLQAEYGQRVQRVHFPDPIYRESMLRHICLNAARDCGATHIAIVDADELLSAPTHGRMPYAAEELAPGECTRLPIACVWNGLSCIRCDGGWAWGEQQVSYLVRDDGKITWQADADGYDLHQRAPLGSLQTHARDWLRIADNYLMHLQFASLRRLRAKQALYQMNEVLRFPMRATPAEVRRRYEGSVLAEQGVELQPIPVDWWHAEEKNLVDLTAEPWQDAEVKRLLHLHGPGRFEGLNLFGLAA